MNHFNVYGDYSIIVCAASTLVTYQISTRMANKKSGLYPSFFNGTVCMPPRMMQALIS